MTGNVERFDKLFLRGEPYAAQPDEAEYLEVLARAGYVRKTIAMVFRPCVRVFFLYGHFIATDLLSHAGEDQVFSLMMEQVLLVCAMEVRKGDHFLEICLGSGVNTLAAASRGAARAVGVDISGRALAFAKCNAAINLRPARGETKIETFQGNLFEPLDPQDRFDVVLINPPFELVPAGERYFLHSHGGDDGLDVVRAFLPGLKSRLKPGGRFEMFTWAPGDEQNERVSALVAAALPGYRVEVIQADRLPLEDRIATFRDKPGYRDWKNRLLAQGITHVWGVHVRAVELNVSEIVRIEAKETRRGSFCHLFGVDPGKVIRVTSCQRFRRPVYAASALCFAGAKSFGKERPHANGDDRDHADRKNGAARGWHGRNAGRQGMAAGCRRTGRCCGAQRRRLRYQREFRDGERCSARSAIPPRRRARLRASGSAISMPSSPTPRPTAAIPQSPGCWRRSTCRCSRPPASPSRFRCWSA